MHDFVNTVDVCSVVYFGKCTYEYTFIVPYICYLYLKNMHHFWEDAYHQSNLAVTVCAILQKQFISTQKTEVILKFYV